MLASLIPLVFFRIISVNSSTVSLRSSQGFRVIIPVPYEAPEPSVNKLNPANVENDSMASTSLIDLNTWSITPSVLSKVAPAGVVALTYKVP